MKKKEYTTVLCSFVEWKNIFNIEGVFIKDNNGVWCQFYRAVEEARGMSKFEGLLWSVQS